MVLGRSRCSSDMKQTGSMFSYQLKYFHPTSR